MTTYTAITTLSTEAAAQALGEAMEELDPTPTGIGVFEIEDGSGLWEVGGYFTERPDVAGLALLSSMHGAADFAVSKLDDRDWVAQVQRELTPVVAGPFFVHGRHDADKVPMNAIGLRIEAAMAFGTGHHGTTLGCLRSLHWLDRQGLRARRVADVGCGTGVLAMGAAALWHVPCVATDIDQVAVETARANAEANGLTPFIRTGLSAGFNAPLLRERAPYDLVFANILAAPLKRLAGDMAAHLAPRGVAILSGLLNRQAPGVEAVYRGHGLNVIRRERIGEWTTLVLRRS
ncbi:50S ribosomal protein L11 methyltransferase [Oceanicella sp. SM1341]|uniref:50S ribosomal protein L11 methyltransferase n=1 Tax=Oceanicella sp. SM1341 TaxID=1548889 RepID=UPI000E500676|nr:50S ribosomal protein L11 methyltransferase [Oceanicella sp. SM1341]